MRRPSPRTAITTIFFLNGAAFAAWYARLPEITGELGLSEGEIGLALLGAPVGLLVAQLLVGALIAGGGSRPLLTFAPLALVAIALPALAVDLPTLVLAVTLTGALNGALDIAMNAQGLAVERRAEVGLFGSLHAGFSFGALTGAAAAGAIAGLGVDPLPHLVAWGALTAAVAVWARGGLIADAPAADAGVRRFARPTGRLAVLGLIAFCALLAEGAIFDWSAIYLAREVTASAAVASLGLAAFSLSMGAGRLATDPLAARFGDRRVVRGGALIACAGLALALTAGGPAVAIAGFLVMGFGLASMFPLVLRAAGTGSAPGGAGSGATGAHSGPDLAAVSTTGYTGFLLGPPLIGLVAEGASLRAALLIGCGVLLVAAAAGRAIPGSPGPARAGEPTAAGAAWRQ